MMKTKTPRPRSGKSRRASVVTVVAKAEGSSPSGELEHVSLFPFLSDRPRSALTPFEELLEESRDWAPPPPPPPPALQPQPQASPMDTDEPVEEKDCCILSQDFFCTPDYITPDKPQLASGFEANKENIPCPKSPEKSVNAQSKRYKRDCSPKGLRSTTSRLLRSTGAV